VVVLWLMLLNIDLRLGPLCGLRKCHQVACGQYLLNTCTSSSALVKILGKTCVVYICLSHGELDEYI